MDIKLHKDVDHLLIKQLRDVDDLWIFAVNKNGQNLSTGKIRLDFTVGNLLSEINDDINQSIQKFGKVPTAN